MGVHRVEERLGRHTDPLLHPNETHETRHVDHSYVCRLVRTPLRRTTVAAFDIDVHIHFHIHVHVHIHDHVDSDVALDADTSTGGAQSARATASTGAGRPRVVFDHLAVAPTVLDDPTVVAGVGVTHLTYPVLRE
ncbi:hypothetical protein GCM10023258_03210 [Terrabacter aeriphilus]|uniref:Uncharacterized protein n=1 Tax=Terrabacter aeriphilus TaxID=515662 RepID=A0ABP9J0Z0_9MICO